MMDFTLFLTGLALTVVIYTCSFFYDLLRKKYPKKISYRYQVQNEVVMLASGLDPELFRQYSIWCREKDLPEYLIDVLIRLTDEQQMKVGALVSRYNEVCVSKRQWDKFLMERENFVK